VTSGLRGRLSGMKALLQYEKCGYNERGRAIYRGNPLIYYELVLA